MAKREGFEYGYCLHKTICGGDYELSRSGMAQVRVTYIDAIGQRFGTCTRCVDGAAREYRRSAPLFYDGCYVRMDTFALAAAIRRGNNKARKVRDARERATATWYARNPNHHVRNAVTYASVDLNPVGYKLTGNWNDKTSLTKSEVY